jgi:hypothetical protein
MPYKLIYEPSDEALKNGASSVTIEFPDQQELPEMLSHYERFLMAVGFYVESDSIIIEEKSDE